MAPQLGVQQNRTQSNAMLTTFAFDIQTFSFGSNLSRISVLESWLSWQLLPGRFPPQSAGVQRTEGMNFDLSQTLAIGYLGHELDRRSSFMQVDSLQTQSRPAASDSGDEPGANSRAGGAPVSRATAAHYLVQLFGVNSKNRSDQSQWGDQPRVAVRGLRWDSEEPAAQSRIRKELVACLRYDLLVWMSRRTPSRLR